LFEDCWSNLEKPEEYENDNAEIDTREERGENRLSTPTWCRNAQRAFRADDCQAAQEPNLPLLRKTTRRTSAPLEKIQIGFVDEPEQQWYRLTNS